MKVVIAGSRGITGYDALCRSIEASGFDILEVVSGGARGVDEMGERWASAHCIPVRVFPADWATHGNAAGPMRNSLMADYCDAAVILWDGESRGTRSMINEMKKRGKPAHVTLVVGPRREA